MDDDPDVLVAGVRLHFLQGVYLDLLRHGGGGRGSGDGSGDGGGVGRHSLSMTRYREVICTDTATDTHTDSHPNSTHVTHGTAVRMEALTARRSYYCGDGDGDGGRRRGWGGEGGEWAGDASPTELGAGVSRRCAVSRRGLGRTG